MKCAGRNVSINPQSAVVCVDVIRTWSRANPYDLCDVDLHAIFYLEKRYSDVICECSPPIISPVLESISIRNAEHRCAFPTIPTNRTHDDDNDKYTPSNESSSHFITATIYAQINDQTNDLSLGSRRVAT